MRKHPDLQFLEKRQNSGHSTNGLCLVGYSLDSGNDRGMHFTQSLPVTILFPALAVSLKLLRIRIPQGVLDVSPKQAGCNIHGLLRSLRYQETTRHFLFSNRLARIFDLNKTSIFIDLKYERHLFSFEARWGQVGLTVRDLSIVIIVQRLQYHPRISSLSQAGMAITPLSSRARKKR